MRRFSFVLLLLVAIGIYKAVVAWNGRAWRDGRVTFAIAQDPPVLVSYEPRSEKLTFVTLPGRLEVAAAFGFGTFEASKLFELGVQKGMKGEILVKTLEKELGIPVDGWIENKGLLLLGYKNMAQVQEGKSPMPFIARVYSYTAMFGDPLLTNFNVFDILRIIVQPGGVSHDRVVFDLAKLNVAQPRQLSDGLSGYKLSAPQFDTLVAKSLSDVLIVEESLTVSVLNTTKVTGLGARVARIINGLGARIILIDSKEENLESCQVNVAETAKTSLTFRRIVQIFGCSKTSQEPLTAEIEILLGEREAQEFVD